MPRRVLFVCLGNICRSPTAQAVFQQRIAQAGLAEEVFVDSAGTAAWHIGRAPDSRSQAMAARYGYDLSPLRARQVELEDFQTFDYILAMDCANLADLRALRPEGSPAVLSLFLDYADTEVEEVPDPYYGGDAGFVEVLRLVEAAADGLLAEIRSGR